MTSHFADTLRQTAATEISKITGGSIDYLVSNAGYIPLFDSFDPIDYL
jgi:NAD(P)-dependent dehydrogenase (short-subunit alcohol dehydrogenase family)